jgi:uncharacterized membrane protein
VVSIHFILLLPVAFTLACLHALPFVSRQDRLFGVAVPREIRDDGEARQILRRYELQLLPWTIAAGLAVVYLPLPWAAIGIVSTTLVPLIAALWIFSKRSREVRDLLLPPPFVPMRPAACWHIGGIYYNPQDPALFVDKRSGLGMTLNFGHPLSWWVLALTLLMPVLVVLVTSRYINRMIAP